MMRVYLLSFLFLSAGLASQSLSAEKQKERIQKVNTRYVTQPKKQIAQYDSLLQEWKQSIEPEAEFLLQLNRAKARLKINQIPPASSGFKESIRIARDLGQPRLLAQALLGNAQVLQKQELYEAAIQHYSAAAEQYEELVDAHGLIRCWNGIAKIRLHLNQIPEAKKYFEKTTNLSSANSNQAAYITAAGNLCFCTLKESEIQQSTEKKQTAYTCFRTVLNELKEGAYFSGQRTIEARILRGVQKTMPLEDLNRVKQMLHDYEQITIASKALQTPRASRDIYVSLAQIYLIENNPKQALAYLEQTESLLVGNDSYDQEIHEVYVSYYKKTNNPKAAMARLEKSARRRHGLLNHTLNLQSKELLELWENEKQVTERTKKELKSKQAERRALEKQEIRGEISFAIGFTVLGAALILLYVWQQKKLLKKEVEREKLNSKIRNLDAVMQGELHERKRLARMIRMDVKQSLVGVQAKMRQMERTTMAPKTQAEITASIALVDQIRDKLRLLTSGLQIANTASKPIVISIENLCENYRNKYAQQIVFQYYGEPMDFGPRNNALVYQMIREPLKNALQHAQAMQIEVLLYFRPVSLNIRIVDDGKGFNVDKTPFGHGLKATLSRVELLKGTYKLESTPKGTQMELRIPYVNMALE